MKTNLFKSLFLITNLISSTVSSVNNSSLPLPETEFKIGQNVSELVKRDEPITLYGGNMVWGTWVGKGGYALTRPCTLSFPVKRVQIRSERLGFLTSRACSNTNYFVKDDNGKLIKVGESSEPNGFGLDYTFVSVNPYYWSDSISKNVSFTEYIIKGNTTRFDLLAMTSSTQPPFTNLTVCVFGGLNGGLGEEMACGEILEFNVTIQVPTPGTNGEEWSRFVNVVKVNMTKDYDLGYMGAPVYIPSQIPFDTQLIVVPVGQVVETLQQYRGDEVQDKDKKIWYYTPIDPILNDWRAGMLELLLGDFSGNEQNSNSSNSKLQKRQDIILYGGTIIKTRGIKSANVRTCTLGFAVRRIGGRGQFNQGYLTVGACTSARIIAVDTAFVLEDGNEVVVGDSTRTFESYNAERGLDYSVIKVRLGYWNPQGSMGIRVGDTSVPVIGSITPLLASEVCFVGSYSGLVCGRVYDLDKTMARTSPWMDMRTRQYLEEYFQHMVWVLMDVHTRAQIDGKKDDDRGAPVFAPIWDPNTPSGQPKQLIGAQPVGIFAEYTMYAISIFGYRIQDDFYFAYTPIQRIFENSPDLELIQTPR